MPDTDPVRATRVPGAVECHEHPGQASCAEAAGARKSAELRRVAPQLACDNGVYVFGMAKPPGSSPTAYEPWSPSDRDLECHTQWCQMIRDWDIGVNGGDTAASAIRAWLDADQPGLHTAIPTDPKAQKELARGNVVIQVEGQPQAAHLSASAIRFWQKHVAAAEVQHDRPVHILRSSWPPGGQPPDRPFRYGLVPGSDQTTGAALTSANFATASRDLSVTQMRNASICLTCAIHSVAALTALASDRDHRWRGDDAMTVWWLRSGADAPILNWLDQPPAPSTVHQVFDQMRAGANPARRSATSTNLLRADLQRPRSAHRDPFLDLRHPRRRPRPRSDLPGRLGGVVRGRPRAAVASPCGCWQSARGPAASRMGKWSTDAPPHAESMRRCFMQPSHVSAPPAAACCRRLRRSRAEIGLAHSDDPEEHFDWLEREHARACLVRLALTRSPYLNGDFTVPGPDLDPDNLGHRLPVREALR